GMNRYRRLEPDAPDELTGGLRRVHFDFAARRRTIAVFRADRRLLHADRPHPSAAAKERAKAVDGVEKVAAVALHHRQQQVAAGVSAEPRVLERRQTRQQHATGFASVAREGERALENVARRQHAELVAKLTRAAAAVEHRHDRVETEPRVVLETAEQAWQPGPTAKAADVQLAQLHARSIVLVHPLMTGR